MIFFSITNIRADFFAKYSTLGATFLLIIAFYSLYKSKNIVSTSRRFWGFFVVLSFSIGGYFTALANYLLSIGYDKISQKIMLVSVFFYFVFVASGILVKIIYRKRV